MLRRVDWYMVTDVSKALPSFETSVIIYQSTRRNNPEDLVFNFNTSTLYLNFQYVPPRKPRAFRL
jgi:hypothetical protein